MKPVLAALALLLLCAAVPFQNGGYPLTAGQHRVLGYIRDLNVQSTADQAIPIDPRVTRFLVTGVYLGNCSATLAVTAGMFEGPARTGQAVIPSQAYAVTASGTTVASAPLAAGAATHVFTASSLFLNISIANAVPGTCDLFVDGIDLSYF